MLIEDGPFVGLERNGYATIHADPPWRFEVRSDNGAHNSRKPKYDLLDLDQIMALPVSDLAEKNCALFLWTIDTHLPRAMKVLDAWGFQFKTVGFYWAKVNADGKAPIGTGFWTRANPEQCWLATRGAPKRLDAAVRRLIMAPRREHSRKPDETYEGIERLVKGPYLDLFARQQRPGWTTWGHEVEKFKTRYDPDVEALL